MHAAARIVAFRLSRFLPADRPLFLFFLALAIAGRLLQRAQHIVSCPDPDFLAIGAALLLAAGVIRAALVSDATPALALEGLAAFVLSIWVTVPLAYVATRSPFPPVDLLLASAERAIGFDARRAWAAATGNPTAFPVLAAVYESFRLQYLLALLLLPRTRHPSRGLDLIRASTLTLCLSCVIAFLFPAIGAVPAVEASAPLWHALHDTRAPVDAGHQMQAIISFPSFHAAMAVLLAWHLRGLGAVSWMVAALDTAMLVATATVGCHHLLDLPAGAALAGVTISLLRPRRVGAAAFSMTGRPAGRPIEAV